MMNLNFERQKTGKPYQGDERQGFTMTYIDHLHSLLLYGGIHSKSDSIYLYDLNTRSWNTTKISMPSKPAPRKYHTAYYDKQLQALIVYGGQADKGRSLDGFDVLFMKEWKWKRLSIKTLPPARQFHTFTPVEGGNFLIFGGIILPYGTFLNDLWVLKNFKSLKETHTLEIPGCSCSEIATKGHIPMGRYAHKAYASGNNFFILGGESDEPEDRFTIFSLNLSKLSWRKHTFNINLEQLVGFSLLRNLTAADNEVMIFGGILSKSKKSNRFLYSLNLNDSPTCKKMEKITEVPIDVLNNCSQIPTQESEMRGMCCSFSASHELVMYKCGLVSSIEDISLEQYLKYIKNEQILSQEMITKVKTLESLHREIQGFISHLYKNYQDYDCLEAEVQKEKKEQIEACMGLKEEYQEIDLIYEQNLVSMKEARKQLAQINQYFEGCIETERDEDLNN